MLHALNTNEAGDTTTLQSLRDRLPDYAKDTRLNLGQLLTPEGAPDLTQEQIYLIALSCAYATRRNELRAALEREAASQLQPTEIDAAKAAATVMAMNNIYYRAIHLAGDEELRKMPARLRMNVIASPGVPKVDFELMCLGVSAINGCGMCIESHTHELVKAGVSKTGIQSTLRIAAVLNATAQALSL